MGINAGGKDACADQNCECDEECQTNKRGTKLHFHENPIPGGCDCKICVNLSNYDARRSPKHGTKERDGVTVR